MQDHDRRGLQRGSTIYPIIETLGASTDLPKLKSQVKSGDSFTKELETLIQAVAALQSNTVGVQITALKSHQRVLNQARSAADALLKFKPTDYSETLDRHSQLAKDFNTFQNDLFAAADLPADPDETWNEFIVAGDTYRKHLVEIEAHDTDRCLYCRQSLLDPAQDLLTRYSSYLEDKISADIRAADATLSSYRTIIKGIQNSEMTAFLQGYDNTAPDEYPSYYIDIKQIEDIRSTIASAISEDQPASIEITKKVSRSNANIESVLPSVASQIEELEKQQQNRSKILQEKQTEQLELKEAIELAKSWPQIESLVQKAKEIDRLSTLKSPISTLARSVTDLAKTASDQLINQSFDDMFLEECDALRAPSLKVQFVGREGRAQRRKVLSGRHRPSKVLSEGEQKVLALADFLAEARLAGINARVIFDDPVSSLDHRRVNEVAERIAKLSADGQVIVFTHDILFATTLPALMEKSERCSLYLITDEDGKGKIARATGLRTDTLKAIKGRINATRQNATSMEGDMRDSLVRHGYSHIRAWCEVFTEEELQKGVTRRYQPNVRMTTLSQIDGNKLNSIGPKVADIFEIACRYIDGHSQPLATLGVSPTLSGLEQHWKDLQELRSQYGQP